MESTERIVNLLRQSKSFFIATSADLQPNVRPFNAVASYDGKVYLYTNNRASAYKHIQKNPKIGICALADEDRWLKITATAVFDDSIYAKRAMLDANPQLRKMYSEVDKIFEVFYLDNVTAKIHSNYAKPEVICKRTEKRVKKAKPADDAK